MRCRRWRFAVLAHEPMDGTRAQVRLEMIRVLARATGTTGMAGGQAVDLAAVGQSLTVAAVENMHRRKTGALIQCSVVLGALAAGVSGGAELAALERFGAEIGLAFQIQDDILDVEGDPALLGKSTGADAAHAKPTYPSTAGLGASRAARRRAARCGDRSARAARGTGRGARTAGQFRGQSRQLSTPQRGCRRATLSARRVRPCKLALDERAVRQLPAAVRDRVARRTCAACRWASSRRWPPSCASS